jgi:hypothetical protein
MKEKIKQPEFYFKVIGQTKKRHGYKQFDFIPKGSPIYEMEDGRVFLTQTLWGENPKYLYPVIYKRDVKDSL